MPEREVGPRFYVEEGASHQWRDGETRPVRYVIAIGGTPRVVCAEVQTEGGWLPLDDPEAIDDLVDWLECEELLERLDALGRAAPVAEVPALDADAAHLVDALPAWAEAPPPQAFRPAYTSETAPPSPVKSTDSL